MGPDVATAQHKLCHTASLCQRQVRSRRQWAAGGGNGADTALHTVLVICTRLLCGSACGRFAAPPPPTPTAPAQAFPTLRLWPVCMCCSVAPAALRSALLHRYLHSGHQHIVDDQIEVPNGAHGGG